MKVLLVGAGVIGTVYGAHFAADGHAVSVVVNGKRTAKVATRGLVVLDALDGDQFSSPVTVACHASRGHKTSSLWPFVVISCRRRSQSSGHSKVSHCCCSLETIRTATLESATRALVTCHWGFQASAERWPTGSLDTSGSDRNRLPLRLPATSVSPGSRQRCGAASFRFSACRRTSQYLGRQESADLKAPSRCACRSSAGHPDKDSGTVWLY